MSKRFPSSIFLKAFLTATSVSWLCSRAKTDLWIKLQSNYPVFIRQHQKQILLTGKCNQTEQPFFFFFVVHFINKNTSGLRQCVFIIMQSTPGEFFVNSPLSKSVVIC